MKILAIGEVGDKTGGGGGGAAIDRGSTVHVYTLYRYTYMCRL